jgi:DNA-binding NarL/FixJ family response regulator
MDSSVTTPRRIQVLLVDDHPAVREGLALLLAPDGIDVVAEASAHAEALARVKERRPDLAIVDLSLDSEDGAALIADLRARDVPALAYSMHNDARHVEGAFAAGALGYVTKRELHDVLVRGVREVAAGRQFVSPVAAVALAQRATQSHKGPGAGDLSQQERQVYQLLGNGEGTYEIAAAMNISTRTVESYYARIIVKLGVSGMYELRHHAITHAHEHL